MPWLSQKIEVVTFPAEETLILRNGWARMLPLHTLIFGLRIKMMDPRLILGHKTHKFLTVIFIERREILRNIKPALLIFGQYSGDPSSLDLGHLQEIVKIDWTVPKLMPICLAILGRLLLVTNDQTTQLSIFICSSLFKAPRLFVILHTLLPFLNSTAHFFTVL